MECRTENSAFFRPEAQKAGVCDTWQIAKSSGLATKKEHKELRDAKKRALELENISDFRIPAKKNASFWSVVLKILRFHTSLHFLWF